MQTPWKNLDLQPPLTPLIKMQMTRAILLAACYSRFFQPGSAAAITSLSAADRCKVLPGDASWPSDPTWSALNETVQGRLIKTESLASICHDPTFEASQCAALTAVWDLPQTQ